MTDSWVFLSFSSFLSLICILLISKIKCFHLKEIAAQWVRCSLTEMLTRNRPFIRVLERSCYSPLFCGRHVDGAGYGGCWWVGWVESEERLQFCCIWTCPMMEAVNEKNLIEAVKIRKRKRKFEVRKFKDFMRCPVKWQRMYCYGYLEVRREFLNVQLWKSWCEYFLICINSLYR